MNVELVNQVGNFPEPFSGPKDHNNLQRSGLNCYISHMSTN